MLPRLKQPMFDLLDRLGPLWTIFRRSTSDLRTRRALARRGLAEFQEHMELGFVRSRLTPAGMVVRDAHIRKMARRQSEEWRTHENTEKLRTARAKNESWTSYRTPIQGRPRTQRFAAPRPDQAPSYCRGAGPRC